MIKAKGLTDFIQEFWVSKYKMPERNSSSSTLGRRTKWTLVATHHCNDRVHTGCVVSQDFSTNERKVD